MTNYCLVTRIYDNGEIENEIVQCEGIPSKLDTPKRNNATIDEIETLYASMQAVLS